MPAIHWFRRDLRLNDNAALYHALNNHTSVIPIFIFDTEILDLLEDKEDARVQFIHDQLKHLQNQLKKHGSNLWVYHGQPLEVFKSICEEWDVSEVYSNRDYEPYAFERDKRVKELLNNKGIDFMQFKDQVIFEMDEITKDDGDPYTVFTPYSKKWKAAFSEEHVQGYDNEKYFSHFIKDDSDQDTIPTLESIGFRTSDIPIPPAEVKQGIIKNYSDTRNFPSIEGTSRLGIHYRFGTISIREKTRKAIALNETYLNELIWREFYMMILYHFPHVVKQSFKPAYDHIKWRNDESEFQAWCKGQTGYPIVDAGMRELNETGYMHNRVRMIVASFLCKHLLIDWRWGEAYFAKKLLDFDLSANNGGWQWAAGSGCDAAPYFRIFNPYLQTDKFDKDRKYIQKWVPEYETDQYPEPIVDHKLARQRALDTYKAGLDNAKS